MASASPKEPDAPTPKGPWGTVLKTTPIVLTVLATALAGISSSEMTQSMYHRSIAAQQQSKAGDQWAFFQAKRIRGTSLETTVETIQALAHPAPFDPAQIDAVAAQLLAALGEKAGAESAEREKAVAQVKRARETLAGLLADEKLRQSLPLILGGALPKVETKPLDRKETQEAIDTVVKAISQRRTETETAAAVRQLTPADIEEAVRHAEQAADAFDKANETTIDAVRQLRSAIGDLAAAVGPLRRSASQSLSQPLAALDSLSASFTAASLDFEARRYRQEAAYNRKAAELYEVRVRRSAVESDRHRERSKKFFYAMLVAQMGVTVSSLALARAQRSVFWLFAAAAGAAAVAFSGSVYLSQ